MPITPEFPAFFKLIRASIDIYQKIKPATELIKLSDNIVLVQSAISLNNASFCIIIQWEPVLGSDYDKLTSDNTRRKNYIQVNLQVIKRGDKQIVLCNIFTATVSCEEFLPFPSPTSCFESSLLYTVPNAPSPMTLCKEMSSKRTSQGSTSFKVVLKTSGKYYFFAYFANLIITFCGLDHSLMPFIVL